MKISKCIECTNEAPPEGKYCALCKVGVTQMYDELVYLLTIHNSWGLLQKLRKVETCDLGRPAN